MICYDECVFYPSSLLSVPKEQTQHIIFKRHLMSILILGIVLYNTKELKIAKLM